MLNANQKMDFQYFWEVVIECTSYISSVFQNCYDIYLKLHTSGISSKCDAKVSGNPV